MGADAAGYRSDEPSGHHELHDPDGFPLNKRPWGALTAIDLDKGEFRWQAPLGTYPQLDMLRRSLRLDVVKDGKTVTTRLVAEGGYPWAPRLDGGFTVLELSSRGEAIAWAARIAKACRCKQELRVFQFDPQS